MRSPGKIWKKTIWVIVVIAFLYPAYFILDFIVGPFSVAHQVWYLDNEKTHSLTFNYVKGTHFHLYLYFPDADRPAVPFSELRGKITIHWSGKDQIQHVANNASWSNDAYEQCKGADLLLIGSVGGLFSEDFPTGPYQVTVSFAPDFPWPKRVGMKVVPWRPSL